MANRQIIIVKAGSDIKDKAGLAGKIVGVQESSVCRGCHEEGRRGLQDLQGIQDSSVTTSLR